MASCSAGADLLAYGCQDSCWFGQDSVPYTVLGPRVEQRSHLVLSWPPSASVARSPDPLTEFREEGGPGRFWHLIPVPG